jgi:hypothetical protein
MFVGYVKFPSMRISTFVNTGNLMAVNMLYVTPLLNIIVALLEWFVANASKPGVSFSPGVCGTTNVSHANAIEVCKRRSANNIGVKRRAKLHDMSRSVFILYCRVLGAS